MLYLTPIENRVLLVAMTAADTTTAGLSATWSFATSPTTHRRTWLTVRLIGSLLAVAALAIAWAVAQFGAALSDYWERVRDVEGYDRAVSRAVPPVPSYDQPEAEIDADPIDHTSNQQEAPQEATQEAVVQSVVDTLAGNLQEAPESAGNTSSECQETLINTPEKRTSTVVPENAVNVSGRRGSRGKSKAKATATQQGDCA